MWFFLIGLFCLLAVIGFFATGKPLKFAAGGIIFLIGGAFLIFAIIVIWSLASPCTAPFSDCQSQSSTNTVPVSTSASLPAYIPNVAPASTAVAPDDAASVQTTAASATIDQSSLTSTSPTPTITGTFSNLNGGLGLFVATQPLPTEIPPNGPGPTGVVFSDASDHGGGVNMSTAGPDASGTYSDTFWQALANGTYYVGIYETSTIYNSSGFQGYNTSYLLTSSTLTVAAP